jgi:hypothetical protein
MIRALEVDPAAAGDVNHAERHAQVVGGMADMVTVQLPREPVVQVIDAPVLQVPLTVAPETAVSVADRTRMVTFAVHFLVWRVAV